MEKITKKELIEMAVEELGFKTKKEVAELLDNVDAIIEVVAKNLEVDQKVRFGKYFTLEKRFIEEKSGTALGHDYVTPAHEEIKLGKTQYLKDILG